MGQVHHVFTCSEMMGFFPQRHFDMGKHFVLFIAAISEDTVDSAEDKEDLGIPGTALPAR